MEFYIIVFLNVFPIAFRTVFFVISGAMLAAQIDLRNMAPKLMKN